MIGFWWMFLIMFVTFVMLKTFIQAMLKIKMTFKLHFLCLIYEIIGILWMLLFMTIGVK